MADVLSAVRYPTLEAVANHPRRLARPSQPGLDVRTLAIPGHERATEEVPVQDLGSSVVRLLITPTMIDDVAAGDSVHLSGSKISEIVERSGNVGVLFEFDRLLGDLPQLLAEHLDGIGGWVDGWQAGASACVITATIPLGLGFGAIESSCGAAAQTLAGQWFFKNVYGTDGAPLGWWEQESND